MRTGLDGRYTAALAEDPLTNLIYVQRCDTGRTSVHIPSKRIPANAAYDIDILERTISVLVKTDQGPVEGASTTFAPVKNEDAGGVGIYYPSEERLTNAEGQAVLENVPADKPIVVCARHAGYPRTCTGSLSIATLQSGKVTVVLGRTSLQGKVAGHEGTGIIAFVDRSGRITEQATLSAGGEFELERPHLPEEHIVYASSRRPLTVWPGLPRLEQGASLILTPPAGPSRSFVVSVPGMTTRSGFLGIWVDDRYIPLDILLFHHDHRGLDALVERDRPVRIVDVAETGAITVSFAPELPRGGAFADPFTLPEYAGAARHRVRGPELSIPAQ